MREMQIVVSVSNHERNFSHTLSGNGYLQENQKPANMLPPCEQINGIR
jgi:hypothetical protein